MGQPEQVWYIAPPAGKMRWPDNNGSPERGKDRPSGQVVTPIDPEEALYRLKYGVPRPTNARPTPRKGGKGKRKVARPGVLEAAPKRPRKMTPAQLRVWERAEAARMQAARARMGGVHSSGTLVERSMW